MHSNNFWIHEATLHRGIENVIKNQIFLPQLIIKIAITFLIVVNTI